MPCGCSIQCVAWAPMHFHQHGQLSVTPYLCAAPIPIDRRRRNIKQNQNYGLILLMRVIKKLAELFLSKPEQASLKQEHAERSSNSSCACVAWKKPWEQTREARASLQQQHAGRPAGAGEGLANAAKWACPSQQSSAAQTPSSTRPSSKEHQRSSSGSDTLSERDEQDAQEEQQQQGPQEGKASLDMTCVPHRHPHHPRPASPPSKPAASSTWFNTSSTVVAQQQQQQQQQQVRGERGSPVCTCAFWVHTLVCCMLHTW